MTARTMRAPGVGMGVGVGVGGAAGVAGWDAADAPDGKGGRVMAAQFYAGCPRGMQKTI
ncbi:hypothetical protein GHA01_18010 [Novacetimonas hansenii]|uniref:Uncharacterized protein n=2 Tax=Novacetimonas hansenii TaxID=436 RepID=A0ABQ0SF85_NOVHA|nr:hypothetical protein Gaha_0029_023 [Novacetimonas hansenii JCM 7643]GEC63952.1 hypothetical protein GHA01_18010 [Novacetimonas hansenii]